MAELSRRLKWQRRMDDYAGAIGDCILYVVFAAFLLGLILLAVFGTPLSWMWWLLIPFAIGAVLTGIYSDERTPEEKRTSRHWRR